MAHDKSTYNSFVRSLQLMNLGDIKSDEKLLKAKTLLEDIFCISNIRNVHSESLSKYDTLFLSTYYYKGSMFFNLYSDGDILFSSKFIAEVSIYCKIPTSDVLESFKFYLPDIEQDLIKIHNLNLTKLTTNFQ